MVEKAELPVQVVAAVTVRYKEPGVFPPRFKAIPKDTVFNSSLLPAADIWAMLRQKTVVPHVAPPATPAAEVEPDQEKQVG